MVKQIRVPLEVGAIQNGAFIKRLNRQLGQGVAELIAFVKANPAQAKGAKSKLAMEVTIACEGGEPTLERFSVKAQSKLTVPAEPVVTSKADLEESQTGELELRIPFTEGYVEPKQGYLPLKGDAPAGADSQAA